VRGRRFRGSEHVYEVALPSGALVHCLGQGTSTFANGTSVALRLTTANPVVFLAGDESRAFRGRV
jgi:hypothetical protein